MPFKLADLVLIDLPLDEVKDIFSGIAQWIKKDAVLLYFSALPEIAARLGWNSCCLKMFILWH